MIRVAAVDIGTNSLRLLIADLDPGSGRLDEVQRRTMIVRLGQDVDRTQRFADEALTRTFAGLDTYRDLISAADVGPVRCVATSAARDVANRDHFAAGVQDRLGVVPEVISGQHEAQLSYDGATRGLGDDVVRPVVVLDVGGGSTELVRRDSDTDAVLGVSLDIGSVRLTERHLPSDPPTQDEIQAAAREVQHALDTLPDELVRGAGTLIGVAGTVTTLAAIVLELPSYDRERVEGAWVSAPQLGTCAESLARRSVAERVALPCLDPGRADVIAAGALILVAVVRRLELPGLRVSEHDILDGVAWSLV